METEELMSFPQTVAVLEQLAEDVKEGYADFLRGHGHYTTKNDPLDPGRKKLMDSIETIVTVDGHSFTASLKLNAYWQFLEEGIAPSGKYRNPGWKAFPFIANWVEIKPVIPRPNGDGKIPTPKQLSYLIGRKIVKEGTKGAHGMQKTKDAIVPYYIDKIEEALSADIGNYIRAVFTWE